jgi:hypothetical protein
MVQSEDANRCHGEDGYSAGLVALELRMTGQRYPTCRACGCRKYHKTREEAQADADKARALLSRLVLVHGSVVAVARAYADRHGGKMNTAQRRLYRLRGARHALYSPFLIDELEVML